MDKTARKASQRRMLSKDKGWRPRDCKCACEGKSPLRTHTSKTIPIGLGKHKAYDSLSNMLQPKFYRKTTTGPYKRMPTSILGTGNKTLKEAAEEAKITG